MAHILAAGDAGPRPAAHISPSERSEYKNLILLCPICHTIIDKAPSEYPDGLVRKWKATHKTRIAATFAVVLYDSRPEVRQAVEPLLAENKAIFDLYGPDGEYRFDPESEAADVWKRKALSHLLPNNRRLLAILDRNRGHLSVDENKTVERFRQHVDDFEQRHILETPGSVALRFPVEMNAILED